MSVLARRYAGALLEVATGRQQVDQVYGDLEALHGELAAQQGRRSLEDVVGGKHELVRNTVATLARRQRLEVLRELFPTFRDLVRAQRGEAAGVVQTATDVSPEQRGQLEELARTLSGASTVHLEFQTREDLIGGVRLTVGNTLYDGSVATALRGMRRRLENVPLS